MTGSQTTPMYTTFGARSDAPYNDVTYSKYAVKVYSKYSHATL